jgi:HEAT repeats
MYGTREDFEDQVKHWVEQLLTSAGAQKQQAASELTHIGVQTRGSVRTRGSLTTAAKSSLPQPDKLKDIVRSLDDADKQVRCQVTLALGEWGDERAAAALRRMLESDADETVQLYCVTALRTIGGMTATAGLGWAAEHGTPTVRDAAIQAIEDLLTGGPVDDTEGPSLPQRRSAAGNRSERSVRTRGTLRTRGGAQIVTGIVDTLQHIQADNAAPAYLRRKADRVLGHLGE